MMEFCNNTETVEGIQFTGNNVMACERFVGVIHRLGDIRGYQSYVEVPTAQGIQMATIGDYIIKVNDNEYEIVKPPKFEETWEPVS